MAKLIWSLYALASALVMGGDVSVWVWPLVLNGCEQLVTSSPAQLSPEWCPLLQIEELRAVGEERVKGMRDGKPQVRPESVKCYSSLISSIITRWQLSFSLIYDVYAKLYLDCTSHLLVQTRLPEANCRKMNRGKQFLIQKDESSDSEEPAEGWKANNHDTPPPTLCPPCSLCHFKALPQNTQRWAMESLLSARLVCHVMYFCYIWDCQQTPQQSRHVLIGQKYQWKLNMPKKRRFFRNLVQVNKMMQNEGNKIWNVESTNCIA